MQADTIDDVLARLHGVRRHAGYWTARCPAHDDKEPSLLVRDKGSDGVLLKCFAGCRYGDIVAALGVDSIAGGRPLRYAESPEPTPVLPDLADRMARWQADFPGSPSFSYLAWRGIDPWKAAEMGAGHAEDDWPGRRVRGGRVVLPHTRPDGLLVNVYGRAIRDQSKTLRHDHLAGNRGMFNAPAIRRAAASGERIYVVEGGMDALSLETVGIGPAVAVWGVAGARWAWMAGVRSIVLGFDRDHPGRAGQSKAAREIERACLPMTIEAIPAAAFGSAKDLNEALAKGALSAWART